MELLLYKFMLILAYSCTGLVRCEMIEKNFITEQVCFDSYGTVLETSDQVRGKIDCGSRCIKNNCTSFLYNQDLKLCTLNSEMFFNRTTLGCNNLVYYAEVTVKCFMNSILCLVHFFYEKNICMKIIRYIARFKLYNCKNNISVKKYTSNISLKVLKMRSHKPNPNIFSRK
jgi:hypothetical protein